LSRLGLEDVEYREMDGIFEDKDFDGKRKR
jgi:hypothetical protein